MRAEDRVEDDTTEARIRHLEAVALTGGSHRRLTLAETAEMIGRKVSTLRGWLRKRDARVKYRTDVLMLKIGGRWESSPRNVNEWKRVMTAQLHSPRPRRRRV